MTVVIILWNYCLVVYSQIIAQDKCQEFPQLQKLPAGSKTCI